MADDRRKYLKQRLRKYSDLMLEVQRKIKRIEVKILGADVAVAEAQAKLKEEKEILDQAELEKLDIGGLFIEEEP